MTSGKVVTTIGYERRFNPSLGFDDEAAFVEHMLRDQPVRPANMANIVAINQGKRPYSLTLSDPPALPAEEAVRRLRDGHLVLDTRRHDRFGAGHARGAYNVALDNPQFEQHVGWVLPPERPLLLVTERPEDARLVAVKLAFVGLDRRLAGVVDLDEWRRSGGPIDEIPQIDVHVLRREMDAGNVRLLDVREASEWRSGHPEPAVLVSFKQLSDRLADLDLRREDRIAVVCAGGMRSSTACSILRNHGFAQVCNVTDGIRAWEKAGYPLHHP